MWSVRNLWIPLDLFISWLGHFHYYYQLYVLLPLEYKIFMFSTQTQLHMPTERKVICVSKKGMADYHISLFSHKSFSIKVQTHRSPATCFHSIRTISTQDSIKLNQIKLQSSMNAKYYRLDMCTVFLTWLESTCPRLGQKIEMKWS